ncbi:MAG: glycosyltransferase [Phycisphaerales bacterium]
MVSEFDPLTIRFVAVAGSTEWVQDCQTALAPFSAPLMFAYLAVLFVVAIYGAHRYWLLFQFGVRGRRVIRERPVVASDQGTDWPRVTVQLPMFNEAPVAERVIRSACAIDYPRDRLQIQVLDDSTDEGAEIARRVCHELRAAGHDIEYRHRGHREGFKAGALRDGLATASGELIVIFDADFVPPPDILRRVLPSFHDPEVGMVQTRWSHLNRDASWLTRSQAVFLDGHFVIEHTARFLNGRWIHFNGTAGVWRRVCIEDAGGWRSDTLTEDVDLSYRAQLRGWRFIYDPTMESPAELPPTIAAFQSQQHRWNKGSIQTALKLMPSILRSRAPIANKIEAWFHLTSPIIYLFVILMSLLFFPAFFVRIAPFERGSATAWFFGLTIFGLATASASTYFVVAQWAQGRSVWRTIAQLPMLLAVGVGMSVGNSRAVIEALMRRASPFIRTPKHSDQGRGTLDPAAVRRDRMTLPAGLIEIGLGALMVACVGLALITPDGAWSIPFLLIFGAGYFLIGVGRIRESVRGVA